MSRRPRPQLVEVRWLDAATHVVNIPLSKVEEQGVLVERITSGYLLFKDDTRTILAHTYDAHAVEEDEVADLTVIPSGWVLEVINQRRRKPKAPAANPKEEEDALVPHRP